VASGELFPWAPGAPGPSPDPYAARYDGPWGPSPVSDEQLRQLPPPGVPPSWPGPAGVVLDQRPALVGLAVTLAVTASLLWVCGLSLFGVVALAGIDAMSPVGEEGVVFHTLDSFVLRMGDGLWVPLYGFPVASIVTGFLLLVRRPWVRLAHSAVGVTSLGWAAWWLRDSLLGWFVVALYVGTAVAVLWAPSVGRWYARGARRQAQPGDVPLVG
jgi:hypothetical protein